MTVLFRAAHGINHSLRELGLDYVDLMLIHQPGWNDEAVYWALEQAVRDGKVRSIGISNYYTPEAVEEILSFANITHKFDVLLVFMFDRIGRRDDETPFVVQWFVQQGIEVWSAREGEQRFDNYVDKLLDYIRFWQVSGESEKTSIRVKTKHSQMVQEGQYRGGHVPYGYKLEHQGRTNKKNQQVRDLVVDEDEATIVKEIFDLLTNHGYGTNQVAQYLNEKGTGDQPVNIEN